MVLIRGELLRFLRVNSPDPLGERWNFFRKAARSQSYALAPPHLQFLKFSFCKFDFLNKKYLAILSVVKVLGASAVFREHLLPCV